MECGYFCVSFEYIFERKCDVSFLIVFANDCRIEHKKFSFLVSVVFATLMRDEPTEQLAFGGRLFGGFVGAAMLIGWLLDPLPL